MEPLQSLTAEMTIKTGHQIQSHDHTDLIVTKNLNQLKNTEKDK